jgi:hypothetical protein
VISCLERAANAKPAPGEIEVSPLESE